MIKILSLSLLLLCSIHFNGQETAANIENPLNSEKSTLNSQHKFILEQSRTYVNNKVVKIEWIKKFYSNAKDSLKAKANESAGFEKSYLEEKIISKEALESVTVLKEELGNINSEKDNITLFGSPTSKSSYKTIVWSIIIGLLVFLLFFVFKFKSSNSTTKNAQEKLIEVEHELEESKKRARTKEQELMRKLQDEINKNN